MRETVVIGVGVNEFFLWWWEGETSFSLEEGFVLSLRNRVLVMKSYEFCQYTSYGPHFYRRIIIRIEQNQLGCSIESRYDMESEFIQWQLLLLFLDRLQLLNFFCCLYRLLLIQFLQNLFLYIFIFFHRCLNGFYLILLWFDIVRRLFIYSSCFI